MILKINETKMKRGREKKRAGRKQKRKKAEICIVTRELEW